jgi:DNA-binding NarL/FixJ family response regulator
MQSAALAWTAGLTSPDRSSRRDRLLRLERAADRVETDIADSPTAVLTTRELQVLEMMAAGATNAEIADRLLISISTVKSHVKHILRKLDAKNRTAAASVYLSGAKRRFPPFER